MPSAFSRANSRTNDLVKPPTTVSNFEENSEFSTQFLPSDVASTSAMKNPSEYFESKSNLLNKQPKLASGSDSRFAKPNGIINSTSSLSAVDEEMLSVLQGLYVGVAPKERQYQVPLEEEEEDLLTSAYMPKEAVPSTSSASSQPRSRFLQEKTKNSDPWDLFENSQTTMSNTKTMQNGVALAEDETNLVSTQGFDCNSNTAPVTNQDFIPNVRANKTYPLRKKHIPQKKTEEQLFDDIEEGPNFEQICNAEIQIIGCGVNELIYPIESYEECGFPQVMLNNILAKKYRKPMPIQKAVLRLFMDKPNDIVAHAQTGSGKSAAYLLPLIHQIHKIKSQYREGINRDSPYALVLLPTKELAIQIYNDAVAFSMGTLTRPVLCYGGYDYQSNREDIHKGCDMIFCTVGRLMGLIKDGTINIGKVIYFILDEADKLINTTEDFLVHVKYLKENMNPKHRTLMFSATFDDQAQETAHSLLRKDYYIVKVGEVNNPVESVAHNFIEVQQHKKIDKLIEILQASGNPFRDGNKIKYKVPKTVVFVNTKKASDKVAIALTLKGGIKAWSMNGDRPQALREEALNAFLTDDNSNVLVSTALLARGHNIKNLFHVINYDLPTNIAEYVHRVGRTGRKGNKGNATSFFNPDSPYDNQLAAEIVGMMYKVNQEPPDFLVELVESQNLNRETLLAMFGDPERFSLDMESAWNQDF